MSVSREQVRAIAGLARLRLTDAEAETFAVQLSGILEHAGELAAAQADDMHDLESVAGAAALRTDEPAADPLHRHPGTFAPSWMEGFFAVPRLAAMDSPADEDGEA